MTDDNVMVREQHTLALELRKLCGEPLSQTVLEQMRDVARSHRRDCKRRGVDFPEVAIIPLPAQQSVEVYRRDLSERALSIVIQNLSVKYPSISAEEIAFGLGTAYPQYKRGRFNLERNRAGIILPNG